MTASLLAALNLVLLLLLAQRFRKMERDRCAEILNELRLHRDVPDVNWVARQVQLARDHVEGIRLLLEVSRLHAQSVPEAALRNLEFLGRKLEELGAALHPGNGEVISPPPHECHASPCGR